MKFRFLIIALFLLSLPRCARIGHPTGGEKDTTPPKLIKSIPGAFQTNFKGNEIILSFDEYVQLKNIQQNLLISPPLTEFPEIFPSGFASKIFKIKFKNELQKNTTYQINFGQSISDFNEGNVLKDLQLIFSTGTQIDSLSLQGKIIPIYMNKKPEKIIVGLYPSENFKDSAVYVQKPYYVAVVNENGSFKLNHLKKGTYNIVAIGDENNDYKYKQGDESIAFLNRTINIPGDSIINLLLFKEYPRPDIGKIEQVSDQHLVISFKGSPDSLKVIPKIPLKKIWSTIQDDKYHLWYQTNSDSIKLNIKLYNKTKKYKRKRKKEREELSLNIKNTKLTVYDTLKIRSNIPVDSVQPDKILLTKDHIPVPFTYGLTKKRHVFINFEKKQGNQYQLKILPNAITSFNLEKNKDTIQQWIGIEKEEQLGNLNLKLDGTQQPIFIELLKNDKVVRKSSTATGNNFTFKHVTPGRYKIRIIWDDNQNNKWDSGIYLQQQQPEFTYEPEIEIEIRANWSLNQRIDLPSKN